MGKRDWKLKEAEAAPEKEIQEVKEEMTLEQSRAYRASLYKPTAPKLSDEDKREEFRIFWAREKSKYGRPKELESAIWRHLKSAKMDSPEQFESGLAHFGLKKIRK